MRKRIRTKPPKMTHEEMLEDCAAHLAAEISWCFGEDSLKEREYKIELLEKRFNKSDLSFILLRAESLAERYTPTELSDHICTHYKYRKEL